MILYMGCRECEHSGDLDAYARDVARSGGKVISKELFPERERGQLVVEVADEEDFWRRYKQTDSADFCG